MPTRRLTWYGFVLTIPVVLLVISLTGPVPAQDEAPRDATLFSVTSKQSSLSLVEKNSRIIATQARIKTVDGFDPAVIKVTTVGDPNRIRVQAVAPGITSMVLVDEHDAAYTIEVLVGGDVRQLEAIIRQAFPDSSVHAVKVKDSVLLMGWVTQHDQMTTIVEIAEQFHPKVLNYVRVSGIQQVMLKVRIMEVQRGKVRQLGFNFLEMNNTGLVSGMPGFLAPFQSSSSGSAISIPYGGPPTAAVNPSLATSSFAIIDAENIFQGFIEALKSESLLKILAEPNLVTVNGRPANFISGGEFPILVPGGFGTVTVQFKPFGVTVEFVPVVLGNGRVRMDVKPEVSEKDFTNQVQVGNTIVPGVTKRGVNTQVEMNFGQTLVIAGLISNRVSARTQKVPFLGELPFIGAAFRRVSHDESETELLILVTPEYIAPLDDNSHLPAGPGGNTVSPTDGELFGNGYLETRRVAPNPDTTEYYTPVSPQVNYGRPYSNAAPPAATPPAAPEGQIPLPPASPPMADPLTGGGSFNGAGKPFLEPSRPASRPLPTTPPALPPESPAPELPADNSQSSLWPKAGGRNLASRPLNAAPGTNPSANATAPPGSRPYAASKPPANIPATNRANYTVPSQHAPGNRWTQSETQQVGYETRQPVSRAPSDTPSSRPGFITP